YYASWDNGPSDRGSVSSNSPSYGLDCYRMAWAQGSASWYANPAFWAGCVLLALGRWGWAGLLGAAAVALGLNAYDPFSQSRYLQGFWLWIGSMAGLGACALYQWWRLRRTEA